jgi:hypothetical protein
LIKRFFDQPQLARQSNQWQASNDVSKYRNDIMMVRHHRFSNRDDGIGHYVVNDANKVDTYCNPSKSIEVIDRPIKLASEQQ